MLKPILASLLLMLQLPAIFSQRPKSPEIITASAATAVILWTADFSPDGKYFAVGGNDRLLRVFDAKNHKVLNTYTLPGTIQSIEFHPDQNLLAIALDHQPARILNIVTKKFLTLKEVNGSRALSWNRNGKLLAVGDYDGLLHIYNPEGIKLTTIKKENTKTHLSVDWHPKKDVLLTGSDKIRLFDLSGKTLQTIKHRPEETIILSVKWNPDGKFFATGDYGHKEELIPSLLQFWNEDGKLITSLKGSNAEYRNIRWNKEGSLLATASDGLRLWTKSGEIKYRGETKDLLWGIDWDSKGERIITSSEKGAITLWDEQAKVTKTIL